MSTWSVDFQVIRQDSKGKALMGLRIMLYDGEDSYEVARVAFRREDSENPELDFVTALEGQLDKAEEAIEVMNEFEDERERKLADTRDKARERIREILEHEETLQ